MPRRLLSMFAAALLCAAGLVLAAPAASAASSDPLCVALAADEAALPALVTAKASAETAVTDAKAKAAALKAQTNPAASQSDIDAADVAVTITLGQFSKASAALATAQTAVSTAKKSVTDAGIDCSSSSTTTTTTAPPTTTTTKPAQGSGAQGDGENGRSGDDTKDCSDFDSQEAAQTYLRDHATSTNPDPNHLDANHNGIACEGAFGDRSVRVTTTTAPVTTVIPLVSATRDDGSTANTSGGEVRDVPTGSAQTGDQ